MSQEYTTEVGKLQHSSQRYQDVREMPQRRRSRWRRLVAGAASCTGLLSWVSLPSCNLLRFAAGSIDQPQAFALGWNALAGKLHRPLRCVLLKARWDNDSPPPPRPPREKKMTDVEKQADAIVHAVVAVELLHWHGKLGSTLETAFRKSVYMPVLPRLKRLTSREASAYEDFRMDKTGRKPSRPSRVHDAALEKQFTLGYAFTEVALETLGLRHDARWFPMAQYNARKELNLADTKPEEDPQAKDLVSFCQGWIQAPKRDMVQVGSRSVGHNDAKQNIWILPVFVDHDRSAHAERQALLVLLEAAPIDTAFEGVKAGVTGQIRVYASHTPCISCLSSMCQFTRCFEGAGIKVTFDTWKQTRRWIGPDAPDDIPLDDEDEEDD